MRAILLALLVSALCSPASAAPRLVKDLFVGREPVANQFLVSFLDPRSVFQGVVYFTASDPAHGAELWRSDGTAAGTYRLTDICPGACGSTGSSPVQAFRGGIYFFADDGVSGNELWQSSGVPGSERRVRDLCPGPCSVDSDPLSLIPTSAGLVFALSENKQPAAALAHQRLAAGHGSGRRPLSGYLVLRRLLRRGSGPRPLPA